jgi:hypothetical protein
MQHKKNNSRKMQVIFHKEHVKGETGETLENVLFTQITIQYLRRTPMIHFMGTLEIVATQNKMQNLLVFPSGVQYSGDGLSDALRMIEKSVLYN